MISPARVEVIRALVRAAVEEDLPNFEIKNRINRFTQGLEERQEAVEYLTLLRTQRGDDLNLFTGISNVSDDFFRAESPVASPPVHQAPAPTAEPRTRPGPNPLSPDVVEASRQKLMKEGRWAGEREIAKDLGRSRDAVRYALGKDRRKPRS